MSTVFVDTSSDLDSRAAGRPLRVALVAFYNYESHALRIFHPLLAKRGHEVHSFFFKNYFTYQVPTQQEEDMVVERITALQPDVVAMSVWSTYFQLAGRLSRRIKEATGAVVIWGGIHPQTRPADCLQHADIACQSEGEYVLTELTDRIGLGLDYSDLRGCWVKVDGEIIRNPSRMLISELDVLPLPDLEPQNKYYLGFNEWRDVARWDAKAISYDVMSARGCPFECTFCIHNFTRKATEGLGTYLRRRSVDHVMRELRAVVAARPQLKTIAFSDDIFGPPRPWLEEFCARYKREIGLPWAIWAFPRMVDEQKVRLMRDAGLWAATLGIQSGSDRIRRDSYERETSNEDIIAACETFARHGVIRNLDFIGDNPYETVEDRLETLDLLGRLPKPFYFNFFSLTYFPGVDLTERALRDGHITTADVEDVAEKGYHLWGGALLPSRTPDELRWDVAYAMAVHGLPTGAIRTMLASPRYDRWLPKLAQLTRHLRDWSRFKTRTLDRVVGRPNLLYMFWANTARDDAFPSGPNIQPNYDNSPLSAVREHPVQPVPLSHRPAALSAQTHDAPTAPLS
jgi:anaerobic magnesium-protoporphyrin IX monomethyl ester cyclase